MVTFYVGEQPSDPLIITVRDSAGAAVNLTDVSTVSLVGDPLPAGTCIINNAALGKVQYTFTAPFTVAGSLVEQVKMVDTVAGIDYSAPFTLSVANMAEPATALVTPAQVETFTGQVVSENDIARAQGVISLAAGVNIADPDWLELVSTADTYWLELAVSYQAVEVGHQLAGESMIGFPGAKSLSNGDVRVTFSDSVDSSMPELGSLARAALMRLSWLRPMRSIQAKPFLLTPSPPPDPWITTTTYVGRI